MIRNLFFGKYKLGYYFLIFSIMAVLFFLLLPKYRFSEIVVHHTASAQDNYASIKFLHKQKLNQKDAAYHLILSNGSTDIPMGYLEATQRYRYLSYSLATRSIKHNLRGVHLCIVGNYDNNSVPKRLRGPIAQAIQLLQDEYGISRDKIVFHRDFGSTACPGKYVTKDLILKWLDSENDSCPNDIRLQQEEVISKAHFSIYTIPKWILIGAIGVFFLGLLVWCILIPRLKSFSG